ncbi:MAG: type II toxin-antitoxin system PemK/MazF family toxin [Spirochaetes bacterium]|nr:type II toxin-antitoxin system PemK/MazF family toxin [Spirochaetota bacterium]
MVNRALTLLPFPFSDLKTKKKRPGVIISSNAYNASHYDLVMMAITSKIDKNEKYIIKEWQKSGLLKPSAFKPIIFSVEKALIIKKLGNVSSIDIKIIKNVLKEILSDLI